jgi:hypothetical protein
VRHEIRDPRRLGRVAKRHIARVEIGWTAGHPGGFGRQQRTGAAIGVICEVARKMGLVEGSDVDLPAPDRVGEIGRAQRNKGPVLAAEAASLSALSAKGCRAVPSP